MRAEYIERLKSAMAHSDAVTAAIPTQWQYLDADELDPVAFDWQAMRSLLNAFQTEDFWTIR